MGEGGLLIFVLDEFIEQPGHRANELCKHIDTSLLRTLSCEVCEGVVLSYDRREEDYDNHDANQ